jgi:tetratricopeptide (TPR) repeat protein
MNFIKTYITAFLFVFISVGNAYSQANLKILNDNAFVALEKHSSKALDYANEILELTSKNDTSIYSINAYTILGIINKDRGYYISSLNYYLKALDGAEKRNDQGRISATLSNIGVLYRLQGDLNLAITYFSKSLKIEENLKNALQKSIRYYNIGDCYKELDSFDLALTYFSNSLLIEQKYKNIQGEIYAYLGISEVYLEIGQIVDAKKILDKIGSRLTHEFSEESILYNKLMGVYYLKTNQLDNALSILWISEELSKKNDFPIHLLEIFKIEITILEQQKSWEKVASKYKEYTELSEKLIAIEIRNKVNDLMYSNVLHKKELQISKLQGERNMSEKLNLYNNKIAWFLILLLVFIVGFVFYGLKRNK